MDHHLLVARPLCLRAGIFLVPAGSDPVTSQTLRDALMIAGLLRGENSRLRMSQTRALRALPDVSHRAMRVRAWTLRSESRSLSGRH